MHPVDFVVLMLKLYHGWLYVEAAKRNAHDDEFEDTNTMKREICVACYDTLPSNHKSEKCDECLLWNNRSEHRRTAANQLRDEARLATTPLELVGIWNLAERFGLYCDTIRYAVVENPCCPSYLLDIAAQHEYMGYRVSVACNPKACEYFEYLARDIDEFVRSWIARNQAVPVEIIVSLLNDDVGYVRWFAKRNLQERKYEY